MGSAWIFKRKFSKLRLLIFLIAVYVFTLIYNSYPAFEYFHRKIDVIKFHEIPDLEDRNNFIERKINHKDNGRHTIFGSAHRKRSDDEKMRDNQNLKEKEHGKNGKEELWGMGAEQARDLASTKSTEIATGKVTNTGCKEKGILKRYNDEAVQTRSISCVPHSMSEDACKFTKDVYKIDSTLQRCSDNNTIVYCYLKQENRLDFSCMNMDQYRYCKISCLNMESGDIVVESSVSDLSRLGAELKDLAIIATAHKSNFLFLQCFPKTNGEKAKTQLIPLPYITKEMSTGKRQGKLNINVVLLDSISRRHFYHSLPEVLHAFNKINSKQDSMAEVLDFELFQSVHGHSAENFHALFTGKLLSKNLTATKREYANVEVGNLYGSLKELGYETMYQDDLCWKYWWGTRMELGMAADWKALQGAIQKEKIDHTGLTFASCKILGLNGLQTPFSGPENSQICLNGRFQHSYIFEHLLQYFSKIVDRKQRVSFTTINTGHDYKGIRVQTLNKDLSTFVMKLSALENTLTILMADHGNTYTAYTSTMLEGRFEMHHPSFFMILPESVKKWLGAPAIRILRQNTKRLFTMIDVHTMIKHIAKIDRFRVGKQNYEGGLLSLLPTTRQCDDLELALPSLCICEGWDTPARNDTEQTGVLEFAVGTLNNLIHSQRKGGSKAKSTEQRNCHRLFARSFKNVRQRSAKGDLITTLDFAVDSGRGSGQKEDVFHVEIRSTIAHGSKSRDMALLSYDRISQYGIYRQCKDPGVNVKLCVCSIAGFDKVDSQDLLVDHGSISISALLHNHHRLHNIPSRVTIKQSMDSECILLSMKEFLDETQKVDSSFTVVAEILNICSNRSINTYLSIETNNCQTSHRFPMVVKTEPLSIRFVSVIIRTVWYWSSSYQIFASTIPEMLPIPEEPHLPPASS